MSIVSLVIAPYLAVDNTPVHVSIKKEISIEKKRYMHKEIINDFVKNQIPSIKFCKKIITLQQKRLGY